MSHLIQVEFYPNGLIRGSVLDYVKWRRERGASARSIRNAFLRWKKNVILAPNGTIGAISKVLFEKAGSFHVPTFDVSLPEFWRIAHDIEVSPDERPLLVVKSYNMDVELTYPPSCVFFDEQSLYLNSSVIMEIDGWKVETIGDANLHVDAERLILNDIRDKLLGKTVKATGSIVQASSRLYFFPKIIGGVYQL